MKYLVLILCLFVVTPVVKAQSTDPYPTRVVAGVKYRVHKVAKGETLYKIGKTYSCSVEDLKKINKNTDNIKIGDELLIPVNGASAKVAEVNSTPPKNTINHTVKKGETLNKIAKSYGISVAEIKAANNLSSDNLKIGQTIKIPAKTASQNAGNPVKVQDTSAQRPVLPKPKVEKVPDVNPGMPERPLPVAVNVEVLKEKEDILNARVVTGKMEDQRMFMMHPSLPKGTIVEVIHSQTGRMAYCRVVEHFNPSDFENAGILITPAVADKIGFNGISGELKIRYATP